MQKLASIKISPLGLLTKRLLGQVLVEGKFISKKTLGLAIKQQKETNEQLGEILVNMGAIDAAELKAALSIQSSLTTPVEIFNVVAGTRQRLGELLTQTGRISREQLELALAEQKKTGEKIGKILVRLCFLTGRELDATLRFQKQQEEVNRGPTPLRLGEILVTTGDITREQLDKALKRQKITGKKIGEVLVQSGYIKPGQVSRGLKLQRMLMTAALTACLSLVASPNGNIARAESSSSTLTVTARVVAHANLKVLFQVREIVITKADIQRGYVDLKIGSRIETKSNSPAGYLLNFEGMSWPFKHIEVYGLANEILSSSGSSFAHQPPARGPVTVDLSHRFALSEDAKPATYAWPLMLSTQPV